jgi:hypothetical protein
VREDGEYEWRRTARDLAQSWGDERTQVLEEAAIVRPTYVGDITHLLPTQQNASCQGWSGNLAECLVVGAVVLAAGFKPSAKAP